MDQAQLKLEDNIKRKDLESKLKESTSLSEKQIQEIVPVILNSLKEIHNLEKEKAEATTKDDLKDLKKSVGTNINNDSDVTINMKNNEGTVIGAMNFNKITNNISITINQPKVEPPKVEPSKTETPKVEAPKVEPPKTEIPKVEAPKVEPPKTEQLVQNNTSVDNNMADIHTLVGFLSMVDKLLGEIEDTKKGISKKGLSKAGKKTMDNAKKKLEQYEKQLKGKKEGLKKQNRSVIYDTDISHLQNLWKQLEGVREEIGLGQWGDSADIGSFLYNSPENAKEANKRQTDILELNQKLQEEVKKGAILNIFNGNVQTATDFYRRIAQGEYTQADYELFRTNGVILTPSFQNCGIAVPVWPKYVQTNLGGVEYNSGSVRSVDYTNMDWGETFEQGGIAGLMEKGLNNCKNMTQGQRDTWKNLGVLGCIAGGIYLGYKFFASQKMSWGKKIGITAATVLGSQMLTGEGPISLIKKLITGGFTKEYMQSKFGGGIFGEAVNGVGNSGVEAGQNIVPSMYAMMIFNEKTTVGDIRNLTAKFRANGNEWVTFRQDTINKLKSGGYGDACVERFSATFSNNFDEQKWKEWLASMGITDATDDKKTVYELANNSTFNEVALTKFKSENGLKETDVSVKKQELHDYIKERKQSNQAIDVAVLETHKNDWFKVDDKLSYTERNEDKQNKEKLVNQVDSLLLDSQKKEELKQAIQTFYDERTINNKPNLNDFLLRMENGFLVVKSHNGAETKINLKNNSIKGFGSKNGNNYEIRFSSLPDLFNVADLTNDILCRQRGQKIVSMPPFQCKNYTRKGICFNDAETLSFGLDTRVLSTGWGGATSKIDTLYEHPDEYAQYLSDRWIEDNKINLASYPLTKTLSDSGIRFFDEQEVRRLEIWLTGVKEKLKVFKCHPNGNPFSIKALSNQLRFKTINGKMEEFPENIIEQFPTLKQSGNEERFLQVMNDPSNKMWGSAFR